MPRGIRYSEEFKRDAVAQVTERGYSVQEVSYRLGITTKSLYDWRSKFEQPKQQTDQDIEVRRLKAELARVTEERDILKKATAYFAKDANEVRVHKQASLRVSYSFNVPNAACSSQWILCLAEESTQQTSH